MTDGRVLIDLAGIHNFRVVGPYPLAGGGRFREGMLYRSGAVEGMTPADRAYLEDECGVRTILDLRHPDEATVTGAHALDDYVVRLPLFPEHLPQQEIIAELNGLYGQGPSPGRYLHYLDFGGDRVAAAFRILADESRYPVLVHCTAGKDRTGVLVGLAMGLVGCADEDVAAEYALSDASIDRLLAYLKAGGRALEGTDEEIKARLATPAAHMAGFVQLVRERYGGPRECLRSLGVDDGALDRVCELLTAP